MRALRWISVVTFTAALLGGCPQGGADLQGTIDDLVGDLPADIRDAAGETSDEGQTEPTTIEDFFAQFGEQDPNRLPVEPNIPGEDPDADAPDDDPPGDDRNGGYGGGPDDATRAGDGDSDDGGLGQDTDPGSDDDGGSNGGAGPPAAALSGAYGGTITCATWQAIVDSSDPNLFELPEEPAIGSAVVALDFSPVGAPDRLWIPGFIDGPDVYAAVTEAGESVTLDDTYNAMTVEIQVEVLEVVHDGVESRTVADVTSRFRDEFGTVLIRASGTVTQEVIAQPDGTALYRNDLEYEAKLWTPDRVISFDAIEIHDCEGVVQ